MRLDPVVTLSICTRHPGEALCRTLETIKLIRCSVGWELLVVDNGSDDGSYETAREKLPTLSCAVRLVREPRRGVSHARNLALEAGKGDILVFIDDDVDCTPGFLESHVQAFSDQSVHATGGRITPRLPPGAPQWLKQGLHQEIGGPTARYDFGNEVLEIKHPLDPLDQLTLPFTCNCAVRRNLALQVGGFRTDLGWTESGKRIGGEDTDLFSRMGELGGKILYLPAAAVIHRIRQERTTKAYYRQWNISYGRASIVMKGRPTFWKGLGKVIEQLLRYFRYTFLPVGLLRGHRPTRYQKKYRAIGKVLEILRLG